MKASLLRTTTDGKIVTYHGHPLSFFKGGGGLGAPDKKPGQLNGQGVYQIWFVLTPKGTLIKRIPLGVACDADQKRRRRFIRRLRP